MKTIDHHTVTTAPKRSQQTVWFYLHKSILIIYRPPTAPVVMLNRWFLRFSVCIPVPFLSKTCWATDCN